MNTTLPPEVEAAIREYDRCIAGGPDLSGAPMDLPYVAKRKLRAAISSALEQARPQWQPIQTAPRDGSPVLIFTPKARTQVREAWWALDYEGGPGHWQTPICPTGRGYTVLAEAATHWMPLAAAPSHDTKEQQG